MSDKFSFALRWLARASAVVVAGVFLFLTFGEMFYMGANGLPTRPLEWLTLGLFVAGIAAMLLALKWELPGAIVSVACFGLFAALVPLPNAGPVAVAAAPGVLFLADWLLRRLAHVRPAAA